MTRTTSVDDSHDVAVIMAAGQGKRMGSPLPKVLHLIAGKPLVVHAIESAAGAGISDVVVIVGHGKDEVQARLECEHPKLRYAHQAEQRGTGHAVLCALPEIPADTERVVILSGDVPLLRAETIARLRNAVAGEVGLAMLTFVPDSPSGYGRILREQGRVTAIKEEKDATPEEREIGECNAGVYCVRASLLRKHLPELRANNAQAELYLTDLVERAAAQGRVEAINADPLEVAGVNTPDQLQALEREYSARQSASAET